ncbi:MAG: AAA family ATPase [Hyphomicrobiaceae bacterium]|nr:AAA family ATPase [Hyphomicrobiaceae bacterium]
MTRTLRALVGRTFELGHLVDRWANAKASKGGAVLILGEAGIGKSRLAVELAYIARADGADVLRIQAARQRANSDLYPIVAYVHDAADVRPTDPDGIRAAKISAMISRGSSFELTTAMLDALVELGATTDGGLDDRQSPRIRRDVLFGTLLDGLARATASRPVLLIVEDAQWLDPSTVAFLRQLVLRAENLHLLIGITARRDFEPDWIEAKSSSIVVLTRLNAVDSVALTTMVAGSTRLTPSERQSVVERSEGVPLYIEELAGAHLTLDKLGAAVTGVPESLQDALLARLEQLGGAKSLAQICAAYGRRFSHEIGALLWDVVRGDDAQANYVQAIERLMTAEILRPAPVVVGSIYTFRHALLQDTAYESLSALERLGIHATIAAALETLSRSSGTAQPEILAYHYDLADMPFEAGAYRLEAGKAAARRGSVVEAITEFKLGIASARRAAETTDCEPLLFELYKNLGPAIMAHRGYSSDDALGAFREAQRRLHLSRSSVDHVHVLLGRFNVHFGRGELAKALEVAQQADDALAMGYGGYPVLRGQALCMMGRFVDARRALEDALAKYNPDLDARSGLFCQADVVATSFLAKTEFALGHWVRSSELTKTAMAMARQQGHPIALAIASMGEMFFATESGDIELARKLCDAALVHATQHDLSNYVLWNSFYGQALSLSVDPGAAIVGMERILKQAADAGTGLFRSTHLGLLGAAYGIVGQHNVALARIEHAIDTAQATLNLDVMPTLYRFRAKTFVALMRMSEADHDLEMAWSIATAQSARTEALRAATAHARLLKDSERGRQAFERLAAIYSWFDQRHPLPDLAQAKRVLNAFDDSSGAVNTL